MWERRLRGSRLHQWEGHSAAGAPFEGCPGPSCPPSLTLPWGTLDPPPDSLSHHLHFFSRTSQAPEPSLVFFVGRSSRTLRSPGATLATSYRSCLPINTSHLWEGLGSILFGSQGPQRINLPYTQGNLLGRTLHPAHLLISSWPTAPKTGWVWAVAGFCLWVGTLGIGSSLTVFCEHAPSSLGQFRVSLCVLFINNLSSMSSKHTKMG